MKTTSKNQRHRSPKNVGPSPAQRSSLQPTKRITRQDLRVSLRGYWKRDTGIDPRQSTSRPTEVKSDSRSLHETLHRHVQSFQSPERGIARAVLQKVLHAPAVSAASSMSRAELHPAADNKGTLASRRTSLCCLDMSATCSGAYVFGYQGCPRAC